MIRSKSRLLATFSIVTLGITFSCGGGTEGEGTGDEAGDQGQEAADRGAGTEYGDLEFSGEDVDSDGVEDAFQPVVAAAFETEPVLSVSWTSTPGIGFTILTDDGALDRVTYQQVVPGSQTGESFFYQLDCLPLPAPAACDEVALDIAGKAVVFDAAEIAISPFAPNNVATAELTVDGVLTWE